MSDQLGICTIRNIILLSKTNWPGSHNECFMEHRANKNKWPPGLQTMGNPNICNYILF